jgi:hypothetical protein
MHTRFRHHALNEVLTQTPQQTQAHTDTAGDNDRLVQTDPTTARTHHHTTGRKRGGTNRTNRTNTPSADPKTN